MKFLELHNYISKEQTNISQVVVLKNGKKIYSDTWNGFNEDDAIHVMSVTKSIVSILIGIAIDQGLIQDVNQKVLDFFPNYQIKRGEKTIQFITIKHLLTMKAPYKYKYEPWVKICTSEDWSKSTLDFLGGRKGITNEFKYSTLGIHILTGIITKVSGMKVVDYANKYLFNKLGILPYKNYLAMTAEEHKEFTISKTPKGRIWFCDPQGVGTAGYGLCFSANDLAKIGQMVLDDGKYLNNQIVSSKWIKEMFNKHHQCDEHFQYMGYGYLWWIINEKEKIYAAIGNSGNVIYINKPKKIVITVTATFKPTIFDRIQIIQKYIEPIIESCEENE